MIYSRFGTKLTPISKQQDSEGAISIQATAAGTEAVRDYTMSELTADDGMAEINDTAGKLPWKVVEIKTPKRSRHVR